MQAFPGDSVVKSPPANSGGVGSIPGPGDSMCCRVTRPMATNVAPALRRAPAPWWGGCYNEKHVSGGPRLPPLEKSSHSNEDPAQPKINKQIRLLKHGKLIFEDRDILERKCIGKKKNILDY